MSQPTTCFGLFQLSHLQVGYISQRKYMFRSLLVRPSSGCIPQSEEIHVSASSSQAIFRLDTLVRGNTCFGLFYLSHLQVGYISQRKYMFRPLLVRPSSGWIPQSEEINISASSSQAIFKLDTLVRGNTCFGLFQLGHLQVGYLRENTCFGLFQLGHLQVGYLSQRKYKVSNLKMA